MVSEIEKMGTYLGVPMAIRIISNEPYEPLLFSIDKKLASWKIGLLSLVRRITLAQSVLSNLSNHIIQFFPNQFVVPLIKRFKHLSRVTHLPKEFIYLVGSCS